MSTASGRALVQREMGRGADHQPAGFGRWGGRPVAGGHLEAGLGGQAGAGQQGRRVEVFEPDGGDTGRGLAQREAGRAAGCPAQSGALR